MGQCRPPQSPVPLWGVGWGRAGQLDTGGERPSPRPGLTSRLPHSAGGTGVLLNVDRVAEQLEALGHPAIQVRGLVDSGWFLDNKQYLRTDCVDTVTCAPTEAIRQGIRCAGRECAAPRPGPARTQPWAGWCVCCGRDGAPDRRVRPRYWNGVVPERCRRQFKEGEEWNCFFGYKVYPTLRCEWPARVPRDGGLDVQTSCAS